MSNSKVEASQKPNVDIKINTQPLVICPKCRTNIPLISLSSFDSDMYIKLNCTKCSTTVSMYLSEYLNLIKEKESAHFCTNKVQHYDCLANHYCLTCQKWICGGCYKNHSEYNKLKGDFIFHKELHMDTSCIEHTKNSLAYYCKDCLKYLCKHCIKESNLHSNHNTVDLRKMTKEVKEININALLQSFDDIKFRNQNTTEVFLDYLNQEIRELIELSNRLTIAYEKNERNNQMIQDLFTVLNSNFESLQSLSIYELLVNIQNNFTDNYSSIMQKEEMKSKCNSFIEHLNNNYIVNLQYQMTIRSTIQSHKEAIHCMILLQDGRLVTGSKDKTIKIININAKSNIIYTTKGNTSTNTPNAKKANDECEATLEGHQSGIYSLAQLKDTRLVSGSFKEIKLWSIVNWNCLSTLSLHTNSIFSLIQLKNSKLMSASSDKSIRIWDTSSLESLQEIKEHTDVVYTLVELYDGRVASGSQDKTIKLWQYSDAELFKCVSTLTEQHFNFVNVLLQLIDGRLASGSLDVIVLWNVNTLTPITVIKREGFRIMSLLEYNNEVLISGDMDIVLWKMNASSPMKKVIECCSSISKIINLSEGRIASSSEDGVITIWEV